MEDFRNTISVYFSSPISYLDSLEYRESFAKKIVEIGEEVSVKIIVYIPLEAKEEPPSMIVSRDLEAIQKSDFLLAFIFAPTSGCPMEMFYTFSILKKPVLCLCTLKTVSPWLLAHSTRLYKTEQGFFNFFRAWLEETYGEGKN